jgi:cyclopropane-fatty-acyl-phospholipid synthase
MKMALALLEKGLLPDRLLRLGIRRLLARRLEEERFRDRDAFLRTLREGPIAVETAAANEQHYEVPAEFFKLVLGPRLKYSSAWWDPGVTDLGQAEEAMLSLSAERARLSDGQDILDLGCGWGSFSLWAAERYPSSRILAVSNSQSQRSWIVAEAIRRGFRNLDAVTADANQFTTSRRFDRVVSIEMLEHVRNHETLLGRIASLLRPEGSMFVHIFTHRTFSYPFETEGDDNWMGREFFTGGIMPSENLLLEVQDHFRLVERWRVNGTHYGRTAEAWLANLDRRAGEVRDLFARVYSAEERRRRFEFWRVFFMACSELWNYARGEEWGVTHYLFQPRRASLSNGARRAELNVVQ